MAKAKITTIEFKNYSPKMLELALLVLEAHVKVLKPRLASPRNGKHTSSCAQWRFQTIGKNYRLPGYQRPLMLIQNAVILLNLAGIPESDISDVNKLSQGTAP